ncbi:MAG: PHP domain-containing protein, partial [Clostridia bacterium]
MMPDRTLAADVWSYWSLLKALQSPEQIAAGAAESGYGAVLLADWCSLSGALTFVEIAQARGIRPLVGVTVPGPDGAPVRVVGRTQAAWPFLCQLVTTGRLDSFEAPPAGTVAYILAEGAASPPAPMAFPVYRLVSDPAAVPPADQVPLAALPFRYPEPALAPAWEALARVSREAHAGGTAWLAADALRDRFGATHPAVSGWGRLLDQVNEPAVPAYA